MQNVKAAQEAKRYLEHYYYETKFNTVDVDSKMCKQPCRQVKSLNW